MYAYYVDYILASGIVVIVLLSVVSRICIQSVVVSVVYPHQLVKSEVYKQLLRVLTSRVTTVCVHLLCMHQGLSHVIHINAHMHTVVLYTCSQYIKM